MHKFKDKIRRKFIDEDKDLISKIASESCRFGYFNYHKTPNLFMDSNSYSKLIEKLNVVNDDKVRDLKEFYGMKDDVTDKIKGFMIVSGGDKLWWQ